MSIITFKSGGFKETGQTLSLVAIATQLAIEHNLKILVISANYMDKTLENCFWELDRLNKPIIKNKTYIGMEIDSGIEGLLRVLDSNKTNSEIVKNYSRTILRDRLDVLLSTNTQDYQEFVQISDKYPEILQIADRYYDLIFVDLSNKMRKREEQNILNISDLIVFNMTQRLKSINDFIELREKDETYRRRNIMLLLGRYDLYSKYSKKNVTRYLKEKNEIIGIPYNTLFFEACSEGKVIDFFLKLKNIDENDRNHAFIQEINKTKDAILYKLQELQMKI